MLRPDAWFARIRACRVPLQLIEAAGGLLSPLADRLDGLTLAERLDAEVLVVAADRLGTVSHTRLVVEHLEARGWSISSERRRLLGVVLSAPAVRDASTGSNADLLAGWINSPIFTIDRGGRPDVRLLARVLHG
jgi:dethiobiotin synthetase